MRRVASRRGVRLTPDARVAPARPGLAAPLGTAPGACSHRLLPARSRRAHRLAARGRDRDVLFRTDRRLLSGHGPSPPRVAARRARGARRARRDGAGVGRPGSRRCARRRSEWQRWSAAPSRRRSSSMRGAGARRALRGRAARGRADAPEDSGSHARLLLRRCRGTRRRAHAVTTRSRPTGAGSSRGRSKSLVGATASHASTLWRVRLRPSAPRRGTCSSCHRRDRARRVAAGSRRGRPRCPQLQASAAVGQAG